MNIILKAPHYLSAQYINFEKSIFLAGSITGAWNWQEEATKLLAPKFNIFNPRRDNYSTLDSKVEFEQIQWEYHYLNLTEITLFYFSHETLAPITLLEYGKQLVKCRYAPFRKTFVCIHPEYKRKNDVLIQTQLENPQILKNTFDDLGKMCEGIVKQIA